MESSTDIEDPKSTVKIDIVADLVWVGKSNDSWSHSTDTTMQMDMDKEKFLINGNVVEVINGKEMCRNIMRLLVSSVKIKTN